MTFNMQYCDDDILIRPLQESDALSLATLANNENVSKNLRDYFPSPYTLEDAESFIPFTLSKSPLENFAICWKGNFVGICGVHPHDDIHKYTGEMGYWIGEPFWGKGITSTAIKLLVKYCWEHTSFERLQAITFEYNIGSMRVLEKAGMSKEGVLRKHVFKHGKFYDAPIYSIIRPV